MSESSLDLRVKEIMNNKEKAKEIVTKYWNALDEIDTLTRKLSRAENKLAKLSN